MASEQVQCNSKEAHFYDPSKHSFCPHCGVVDLSIGSTVPAPDISQPKKNNLEDAPHSPNQKDEGATIGIVRKKMGLDPVVGWLVCVEGNDKGRSYVIKSERNTIGRDHSMNININDETISRENHAFLIYDPRNRNFMLLAGNGRGLVYLNGQLLVTPTVLQAYDAIELGQTKLLFLPFCGERFNWDASQ